MAAALLCWVYREQRPLTVIEAVGFTLFIAAVCGAIYGCLITRFRMGLLGLVVGAIVGGVCGLFVSMFTVPFLINADFRRTGTLTTTFSVAAAVVAGVYQLEPLFAVLGVGGGFVVLCGVGFRLWPASKPIDLFRCEQCGYDLKGLAEARCPECGRERIIVPRIARLKAHADAVDASNANEKQ